MYCRLLRKYLAHKYRNTYRAMRKYYTLLNHLEYLQVIKQSGKTLFKQSNVADMPEILKEVFNLT